MPELTQQQERRKVYVDNWIQTMLEQVGATRTKVNKELIGIVHEIIKDEFEARHIMSSVEFYPYVETTE